MLNRSQLVLSTTGSVIDLSGHPSGYYFATVVSGKSIAKVPLLLVR